MTALTRLFDATPYCAAAPYCFGILSRPRLTVFPPNPSERLINSAISRKEASPFSAKKKEAAGAFSIADRWTAVENWKVKDGRQAANTFVGLLRAGLFEEALHGLHSFDESKISAQARRAAANMLILLKAGHL